MRDPVPPPDRAAQGGDEAIALPDTMPLLRDETRVEQDAEILEHGWAAHPAGPRNRGNGPAGLDDEIEHPPTPGGRNAPKTSGSRSGDTAVPSTYVRKHLRVKSEVGLVVGAGSGGKGVAWRRPRARPLATSPEVAVRAIGAPAASAIGRAISVRDGIIIGKTDPARDDVEISGA